MDLYSDEFDKRIDRTLKIILLGDADSRKAEIFRAFMNRQEQELEGGGSKRITTGLAGMAPEIYIHQPIVSRSRLFRVYGV